VLQAVSTRADDQYVVVLSNYATPTLRERCRELGADAVFDKSGDIDALLDFCRECALSARATA
jgi:DNA-binding NarL/FixJ family response regulator